MIFKFKKYHDLKIYHIFLFLSASHFLKRQNKKSSKYKSITIYFDRIPEMYNFEYFIKGKFLK